MKNAPSLDLGSLEWVKPEINKSLGEAAAALTQAQDTPDGLAQIQFGQTHLHQARGALTIIGLDGLELLGAQLDAYLHALSEQRLPFTENARRIALRALAVMGNYLYNVSQGQPDQPIRLLPMLQELARAAQHPEPSAEDVFYPDLTAPLPRREQPAQTLTGSTLLKHLRAARTQFDEGLLAWLKAPGDTVAAQQMRIAAQALTEIQTPSGVRALWWSAQAFFDGLIAGVPPKAEIQRLCAQLGSQMRHIASGNMSAQDRLLRAVLFHVAEMPPETATQIAVRKNWHLEGLVIGQTLPVLDEPIAPILDHARIALEKAEQDWSHIASGQLTACPQFDAHLRTLSEAAAKIGRPSLVSFVDDLRQIITSAQPSALPSGWQSLAILADAQTSPQADALRMEMASALLLVGSVLQRPVEERDFQAQTQATLVRLRASLQENSAQTPLSNSTPDAGRQAQERAATRQLIEEIRNSLVQIEHSLDDFFRGHTQPSALHALDTPFSQLTNTFMLMGDVDAQALSADIQHTVQAIANGQQASEDAGNRDLARRISALGFYLEALEYGPANLNSILNPEATTIELHGLNDDADFTASFFEDIQSSLHEVSAPAPVPVPVPHAVLTPSAPAQEAAFTTSPLSNEMPPPAAPLDAPLWVDAPLPQKSAATSPAVSENVDEELLSIFLEEAQEVLDTITTHLEALRAHPGSTEDLVTVRRGFHTLKGSGRMVGLAAFGEAAWSIEQTLNRWMQLERKPTPALLSLVEHAQTALRTWANELNARNFAAQDVTTLMHEAEHLRNINEFEESDPPQAPAQPMPADAPNVEATPNPSPAETRVAALFESLPSTLLDLNVPVGAAPHIEPLAASLDNLGQPEPSASVKATPEVHTPAAAQAEPVPEAPPQVSAHLVAQIAPAPEPQPELEPAPEPEISAPAAEATVKIGFSEISKGLFDLFTVEAQQHLDVLAQDLPKLISDPTLVPQPKLIRAAHTLSGISGTAGIPAILGLARALEHALMRITETGRAVTAFDGELLIVVQRQLENMFQHVRVALRQPESMPELETQLDHIPSPSVTNTPDAADENAHRTPAPEDAVDDEIENAPAVHDDIDPQLLPIVLEESTELLSELRGSLRAWREKPQNEESPQLIARLLHTLKGGARMAGAMTLGEQLHGLETRLGNPEQLNDEARTRLAETLDTELDQLEEAYAQLAHPSLPQTPQSAAAAPEDAEALTTSPALRAPSETDTPEAQASSLIGGNLRIKAETIDQWVSEAGEIGISRTRIEGELRVVRRSLLDLTENVIRLRNQLREIEIQAEVQMHARVSLTGQAHEAFDPLEMDRFTRLQELTRMMAESVNDVTTVQQNLLRSLDGADAALNAQARLTRDLQQVLMRARMLPFDRLADRLHRVVRQSAKDLGKRVNLDLVGGRIEVDRSLLDGIIPPLEHMLRNALAHGIETPEERQAKGKPALGQITLTLSQEGNEILLELTDDGAGLNYERIRQKGVEMGFVSAEETVDPRRLANLIFLPGFTTAEEISAVSGRGVGMDVVRTDISGLGGRVELHSDSGKGTRFSIHLPLTLISTQALLVQAGSNYYAVPASMVAQVLEVRTEALDAIRERGDVEWQGKHYTYRYLPRLLGDTETQPEQGRFSWIMLLHAGAQTVALHVDLLRSTQEIIVKRAGPQLARMVGISGATVMGDGDVVLIINPIALSTRVTDSLFFARPKASLPAPHKQDIVMVVDDSLTVRKITGRMLEREGFKVITAKDGVDALEQLREATPDIILSDIEMPRMDGFDLLRNVRADQRIGEVPVIMITSRLADKHRNYAVELGADHYLGKPYQEEELLELVRHYIEQARKGHR